jgi:putative ABC transport system permease protein
MNLLYLSWSYIKTRPLQTLLNVMVLSLGLATLIMLLLVGQQLQERLERNIKGVGLVVGAKGSPLQLVMSAVFQADYPTGNIPLPEARKIAYHPLVREAVPLSMGDSYKGYRLIGTNSNYLSLYKLEIRQGKKWQQPFEVVAGATVADALNLSIGDTFYSAHGMDGGAGATHNDRAFKIVGVLAASASVADRLLLTATESVWESHEHHHEGEHEHHTNYAEPEKMRQRLSKMQFPEGDGEITAMLIRFLNPAAALQLPNYVNQKTNLQAASPRFELFRLLEIMGIGVGLLRIFGYIMLFIALLSLFIGLYNALKQREYDLAMLRALGSSPARLVSLLLLEALLTGLAGGLLGILLGHIGVAALLKWLSKAERLGLNAWQLNPQELWLLLAVVGVSIMAAVVPAIKAYKISIHNVLSHG